MMNYPLSLEHFLILSKSAHIRAPPGGYCTIRGGIGILLLELGFLDVCGHSGGEEARERKRKGGESQLH